MSPDSDELLSQGTVDFRREERLHTQRGEPQPATARSCANCERCTWNPGPDCGKPEHNHCLRCGHCMGRHT